MTLTRQARALVALVLVTVIWGFSFTWMKQVLIAADAVWGPHPVFCSIGLFMTLRFGFAAALLALAPQGRRGMTRGVWRGGLFLGFVLIVGFVLQMAGLNEISPAVSAFLTSLYVVFTAILIAWRGTHRVTWPLLAGVALATFGAGFIDGPPQITFGLAAWMTVACAAVFAVHIVATDRITTRHAPLPVTTVMFLVTAAGGLAVFSAGMARPGAPSLDRVAALLTDARFTTPLLLASILATVIAISLMNLNQRHLDPVRAAIVYALEPVWAAWIAIGLGYARPTFWLWLGGGAMLAGNLVAEWGASRARASTPGAAGL